MATKSGASHAGAAFLSVVLGALFKNILDIHAGIITDLSASFGSIITTIPGVSLSENVTGFLAISTILAFLWGVAYHYTRHRKGQEEPKNYETDNQSSNEAKQMGTQVVGPTGDAQRTGQPEKYAYQSVSTAQKTNEQLQSQLQRDIDGVKARLDDIHDKLYDAGRRDQLEHVRSVLESVSNTEHQIDQTVRSKPTADGSGRIPEKRQETLTKTHEALIETSDELVSLVRDAHYASDDELDRDTFQACEQFLSELNQALAKRDDVLSTVGEQT